MMRRTAHTILVLFTVGTFVSARQVASGPVNPTAGDPCAPPTAESVFSEAREGLDLQALASPVHLGPAEGAGAGLADTLETYDIQLESEKDGALSAKSIAALVVIGAFVGIALWLLIGQDDEAPPEEDEGKQLPDFSRGFSVPIP